MKCLSVLRKPLRNSKASAEQGSMVVEAALVLPMFMFFVIFLIYIVQMTLISTALQSTVSDTVKTVAAHMYPVSLAVQANAGGNGTGEGTPSTSHWEIPKLSLSDWVSKYSDSLPSPAKEWITEAVASGEEPLQQLKNQTVEAVLDPVVKPMMKPFMPDRLLDYDRIHVSNVHIPNLKSGTSPYFGIEVNYALPIRVPFLNKRIVLQAKAQERLWIGDTGEGGGDSGNGDGSENGAIELLEKPNPAVASKQAKVKVKVEAGASAQLSVYYKSGQSTAKYLGWKTADDNGYIEWEWNVGFNTTPGTWLFVVETADGQRIEVPFTVVARSGS
ncbi:TadE/TadG family type IV pilus assembly protein [Paenibacillus sp. cl141a]|uniref:TadE/TadG family type IV pilus assembly protein n=1 Tax=Paenibacillus sp. cl141a TaxID=1761877 RepID=UPI0020C8CBBD|nr:TadE family protein [Paenibacillus sp. cl141a]